MKHLQTFLLVGAIMAGLMEGPNGGQEPQHLLFAVMFAIAAYVTGQVTKQ